MGVGLRAPHSGAGSRRGATLLTGAGWCRLVSAVRELSWQSGSWPVTPAVLVEGALLALPVGPRAPCVGYCPTRPAGSVDIEARRIRQRFRWAVFGSWRSAPGPVTPTAFDPLAALVRPLCRGSEWSRSSQSFLVPESFSSARSMWTTRQSDLPHHLSFDTHRPLTECASADRAAMRGHRSVPCTI